jgi:hypothetical protein
MPLGDYGAQRWTAIMFGIDRPPAAFYVALCTSAPGAGWDGTGLRSVEPLPSANTGYARIAMPLPPHAQMSNWVLAEGDFVINGADIVFGDPLVDWGQITHWALCDGAGLDADESTWGNMWAFGELLSPIYVLAGSKPAIQTGTMSFQLTDQLAIVTE